MPNHLQVHVYDVHPKLGAHSVLDPRSLAYQRPYSGEAIRTADWEPKVPVLDQEDLITQGIHTGEMFPGLDDLDALGSCGGNTGCEIASVLLDDSEARSHGLDVTDPVAAEKYAIGIYADATARDQWHDQRFPSEDCGTSGLAISKVLRTRGICDQYGIAKTAEEFARDLGNGPFAYGTPWYQAWFEPTTANALLDDIPGWEDSPVAGGHLITATALEEVAFTRTGALDLGRTIVRLRNHWTASWGDNGSFRISLALYQRLRSQIDLHQPRRDRKSA